MKGEIQHKRAVMKGEIRHKRAVMKGGRPVSDTSEAAGNQAFEEGRHLDAIKHYSAALAFNIESCPFAAICLCNRAAAYQSVGQITDAIADCSLAIALVATYPKALSRRASLYERIRDYEQTSNDLRRLMPLLEKQIKVKENQAGTLESAVPNQSDLCQARLRLSITEEDARKDIPLDMYLLLGIEASSSVADIKKAYRKAALSHHPDKRLVRSWPGAKISTSFGEKWLKKSTGMLIDCSR